MDRLGNLEAFVAAAELGNFTRAARKLGLSPSALSRRISQLEAEVGVRLVHRTTRAVRLSDEGRAFFERSRGALRELAEAHDLVAKARAQPTGLLRIEAPTILGRCVVVPAVAELVRRHASVEVELALRDHPADPYADGIDVAVRLGPLPDSGLTMHRLGTTLVRTCGTAAYLKRRGTPRSIDALLRHERIGFSMNGRVQPWRLRDASGIRELAPSRRMIVNTGDALLDLTLAGLGLARMCEFMMHRDLVEVLPDSACERSPIHAVSLPTRQMLPKVRRFVELVAGELRKRDVQTD
jgi:DNA-binding transcriptional LysR family regulator